MMEYGQPETTLVSSLSIAIFPKDDFTGKTPIGRLSVSIKELNYEAILNKSGYYIFLNLDHDEIKNYTVIIDPKENYYNKQSIKVQTILDMQKLEEDKGAEIPMIPNTSYPFPHNITLIRGIVIEEGFDGVNKPLKPISGARVEITQDSSLKYETGDKGDFVFYFKDLKPDRIQEQNTKRFIKFGSGIKFDLKVTCNNYKVFTKSGYTSEADNMTTIDRVELIPE